VKIRGYWGELDAPVILAELVCEKLGIKSLIEFLVDTGSSKTIIMGNDFIRLGLRYSQLQKSEKKSVGIGGAVETYFLPDVKLVFATEDGSTHTEIPKRVFILKHELKSEENEEMIKKIPSLLGRDILDKYTLVVSKKKKLVLITDKEVGL